MEKVRHHFKEGCLLNVFLLNVFMEGMYHSRYDLFVKNKQPPKICYYFIVNDSLKDAFKLCKKNI